MINNIKYLTNNTQKWRRLQLTVSSFQMAESCEKNMTAVKMANRRLSNMRKSSRTTVAGGETLEHWRHSLPTHTTKWYPPSARPCTDNSAMYSCRQGVIHVQL